MPKKVFNLPAIQDEKISPAVAISSIALSLAVEYHTQTVVKDGAMYQQLKLEGKPIKEVGLADVLDIAKQFEKHLVESSDRIAGIIIDAVSSSVDVDQPEVGEGTHVGSVIYDAMVARDGEVSAERLAEDLNITPQEASNIFKGIHPLSDDNFNDINRVFGFPVERLRQLEEDRLAIMSQMFERGT